MAGIMFPTVRKSLRFSKRACDLIFNICKLASNANLYKFAYFAGGTDLVPPTNACWGRFPKPLRSPPAVTAMRSANAVFHTDTKRKSCANGFPIHTAFLLPVYLAERSIFRMFPYDPLPKAGGFFAPNRHKTVAKRAAG